MPDSPNRWQFSLRTALWMTLACAVCFWWFSGPESVDDFIPGPEPYVRKYYRLSGAVVVVVELVWVRNVNSRVTYSTVTFPNEATFLDTGVVAAVLLISAAAIFGPAWWRKRRWRSSVEEVRG